MVSAWVLVVSTVSALSAQCSFYSISRARGKTFDWCKCPYYNIRMGKLTILYGTYNSSTVSLCRSVISLIALACYLPSGFPANVVSRILPAIGFSSKRRYNILTDVVITKTKHGDVLLMSFVFYPAVVLKLLVTRIYILTFLLRPRLPTHTW